MEKKIKKLTNMKNGKWVYEDNQGGFGYVTAKDRKDAITQITSRWGKLDEVKWKPAELDGHERS